MIKVIQSGGFSMFLGGILYLVTTAVLWPKRVETPHIEAHAPGGEAPVAFVNPEMDELMAELRVQREALASRESQLKAWEARLQAERSELTIVTQMVSRAQSEFDKSVLKIRADETANLKRLAKTYADMSPQAATSILKNQDDQVFAKVLTLMKEPEVAGILEQLAKLGEPEAKRAALLAERLRLAASTPKAK
jgi:flagellar motility protein MotE (MotC chaperone)